MLAASSVARADPSAVEKSARAIVESQLAAAGSPQAFLATVSPDAVILGNGGFAIARGPHAAAIAGTLIRAPLLQSILVRIDAGGSDDALWLTADAAFMDANGCGETDARFVELAVADHGKWRVIAMSFTSTSDLTAPGDRLGAPHAGPLLDYLASPHELDEALRDGSTTMAVVGDVHQLGDVGVGRDHARRVLAPLRDRDANVTSGIEVRGKTWGFAAGDVTLGATDARVLLVAIQEDRRWNVVAMHVMRPTTREAVSRCTQPPLSQPSPMSGGTLPASATITP